MAELTSSSYTSSAPMIPGINTNITSICCALCGTLIISPADNQSSSATPTRSLSHPLSLSRSWSGSNNSSSNLWTASNLFKNPLSYSSTSPSPNNPPSKPQAPVKASTSPPSQTIHIFRVSLPAPPPTQAVSVPVSLPMFSSTSSSTSQPPPHPIKADHSRHSSQTRSPSTVYPLCTNGWCLTRLRSTCSLWAFVRTGIVDKVWEEDVPVVPTVQTVVKEKQPTMDTGRKPPVPPRRRGLWGLASAFGERAASWSEGDKDKVKENGKILPTPPTHPAVQNVTTTPPPLPKRSDSRRKVPPLVSSAGPQVNGSDAKETAAVEKAEIQPISESLSISTEQVVAQTEPEPEPFLTPTEEVSLFVSAKSTPEKAPADSASSSTVLVPESPPSAPTPASMPLSTSTVNGNVRSASPAPPPLPRRAAARGPRPMTTWHTSQSPASNTEVALPDTETNVVASSTATDEAVDISTDGTATATAEVAPDGVQSIPEEEEEPASRVPEAGVVVAAAGSEAGDVSSTSPLAPDGSVMPVHTSSVLPEDITKSPPAVQPTPTVREENNGVVGESLDSKNAGEDGEVYVGDATWEERTWKEVVKLREDMFWARVGGLR
jgi:hypothetical protein